MEITKYGPDPLVLFEQKKDAARKKARHAVANGKLERLSCEYGDCAETKTQAHHHDYDLPLDVIWLCQKHHSELHKHFGYVENSYLFTRKSS